MKIYMKSMWLYCLMLLSLYSSTSSTETSESSYTLYKKVKLLERKIEQLLTVTEKHTIELAAKEKRIQSLELIIKEKLNDSTEKKIHPPPPVHPVDTEISITDGDNKTSQINYSKEFTTKDLSEQPHLKPFTILSQQRKRAIAEPNGSIAFYSYMSDTLRSPGRHRTVIFDVSEINNGNAYNDHNGIFTAPVAGLYFFSWTIYTGVYSHIHSEIVKNNEVHGRAKIITDYTNEHDSATTNVIIAVTQGDVVFIRTQYNVSSYGNIESIDYYKSSFMGFKLN